MVGTYTIFVQDLEYKLNSAMEFEKKNQNYLHKRSIHGSGHIRDERRTSELLIHGGQDLHDLSFYFSIYDDDPYELISAESRQTKRVRDFP